MSWRESLPRAASSYHREDARSKPLTACALRDLADALGEFFARAAERWLDTLEDDGTTEAIDCAIAGLTVDHAFTDAAAAGLAVADQT